MSRVPLQQPAWGVLTSGATLRMDTHWYIYDTHLHVIQRSQWPEGGQPQGAVGSGRLAGAPESRQEYLQVGQRGNPESSPPSGLCRI